MTAHKTDSPSGGFAELELAAPLQKGLAEAGFTEQRPIQKETIPAAIAGQDILGLAQTGTGKTAAFVVPMIERLLQERRPGPRALILAPTRELATQIHKDFERLAKFTRLTSTTVYGGVSERIQVAALRKQPDVLIACPGRLLDLADQGKVMLGQVRMLVLDEADQMFDMGFLPDIRRIIATLPDQRQNMLFAATMPKEIRTLADQILRQPHVVELAHTKPAETIQHGLFSVEQKQKLPLLIQLLDGSRESAIVFCRTKHRARRLAEQLDKSGHDAIALQGNMTQGQRDRAIGGFREGKYDVLVATDIASRGIDVAGVSHVINFDVPTTPEAYTHRIGRTGRSGRSGEAFTFVSPEDASTVKAIERVLGKKIERLQTPDIKVRSQDAERPARTHKPKPAKESTPTQEQAPRNVLRRRRKPGSAEGADRSAETKRNGSAEGRGAEGDQQKRVRRRRRRPAPTAGSTDARGGRPSNGRPQRKRG